MTPTSGAQSVALDVTPSELFSLSVACGDSPIHTQLRGQLHGQSMPPQTKMGSECLVSPFDRFEYVALPDLSST
jgi:hypothetical protein